MILALVFVFLIVWFFPGVLLWALTVGLPLFLACVALGALAGGIDLLTGRRD